MKNSRTNIIGPNIRKWRLEKNITQEELALRTDLSQSYINQLENGKKGYSQESLEVISKALDIKLPELFIKTNKKYTTQKVMEERITYKKRNIKKEFLLALNNLPDNIAEHYLQLIKIEVKILKEKSKM